MPLGEISVIQGGLPKDPPALIPSSLFLKIERLPAAAVGLRVPASLPALLVERPPAPALGRASLGDPAPTGAGAR